MIRCCSHADFPVIEAVINEAAQAAELFQPIAGLNPT